MDVFYRYNDSKEISGINIWKKQNNHSNNNINNKIVYIVM